MAIILKMLHQVFHTRDVDVAHCKSLIGKIMNIMPLISGGRFQVCQLIKAAHFSKVRSDKVILNDWLIADCHWWYTVLPMFSGNTRIPDPDIGPSTGRNIACFTDARGGSLDGSGGGCGGIMLPWLWFMLPWGDKINKSVDLRSQLSALELVGPLVSICCGEQWLHDKELEIFVDNQGSVDIFRKGFSSKDGLSNTLVKAISEVATAICCSVYITKISRCSTPETEVADALSKNNMTRFKQEMEKILHKYSMTNIPEISDAGVSIAPISESRKACSKLHLRLDQ